MSRRALSETNGEAASSPRADEVITALAKAQHGVVGRTQLLAAGVAVHTIDYRVRTRRLILVDAGVYRVGPLEDEYAHLMAAVLACGDGTVISHHSAAELWGLVRERARGLVRERARESVHVIATCSRRESPARIRVHRCALPTSETTRHRGIPVTRPARTLLDLAGVASDGDLEHAVATAERQRLATAAQVVAVLTRHPWSRGAARLRALVGSAAFTRSEAEARFLALLRDVELAAPLVNQRVCEFEVDFVWPQQRLIVEVDGYAFHGSRTAFENDRARDAALIAQGYVVLRFTWQQITVRAKWVVARIALALGSRRVETPLPEV